MLTRPFLSSKNPHFQNEAKRKAFLVKMSFVCMRLKFHLHILVHAKGFALTLVLKQKAWGNSEMAYFYHESPNNQMITRMKMSMWLINLLLMIMMDVINILN